MSDPSAPGDERLRAADVQVGDEFLYTSPSGREIVYKVDALHVHTRQGMVMPRSVSPSGQIVFIDDGLLRQDWWRLTGRASWASPGG
jgi:hypothetical protein